MEESAKIITNYGFFGTLMILFLYLGLKYIPKVIEIRIEKAKKRDYREDLLMKTIENNTRVIENNSLVIQQNTDNRHKLEDSVNRLSNLMVKHDERSEEIIQEVKIIKERRS